jgi:hypothetical protein
MTQRSRWAFIARSCAEVTACIRIRLEWNENSTPSAADRMRGSSVSTVTLLLGTISPTRDMAIPAPRFDVSDDYSSCMSKSQRLAR